MQIRHQILLLLSFIATLQLNGQTSLYNKYIDRYKGYAIEQMNRYGIPASITLSQGLLESAAGTSELVKKGNNHFGIKVGSNWKGRYVRMDDDAPREKFRAYPNAKASYEDHSKFLRSNQRYASLFKLSSNDYKGWAHGLKKAGYATNPQYAYLLIDLIKKYDLHQYDNRRGGSLHAYNSYSSAIGKAKYYKYKKNKKSDLSSRTILRCNRSYYLIAQPGDTFESLSSIVRKPARKLRKYNEVDKHYVLKAGDIVYLEEKRSKADRYFKKKYHIVRAGESLHSISQHYGMKLKTLIKNNRIKGDYRLQVGARLKIR